jgi:hypothetical protein
MHSTDDINLCEILRDLREQVSLFPQISQINAERTKLKYDNDA